jgi:uncharacterized lipoprotein YmbA
MKSFFVSVGLSLCLLFLVGGASSPTTRHYVLSPLTGESKVPEESCITIGIGPIKLPEYVNRPQIVTRTSPNELALAHFDLWAEPLTDSVPRMLAENLSRLICTKEVVLFPWRPSLTPEHRVEVELLQLDGTLGSTVSLEAWWSVAHGKTRVTRKATYSEPAADKGYDALVQAHSRALAALSRDIAGALKQMK